MYKESLKCPCCSNVESKSVFWMEKMPMAGQFCDSEQEAKNLEQKHFEFLQCTSCETVYSRFFVDPNLIYSKYSYESSQILSLKNHFASLAQLYSQRFSNKSDLKFCEVGCNDGVLLNQLPESWDKVGIDPSNVSLEAERALNNSGWRLVNSPISEDLIESEGLALKFDIVSASNCMAHFPELETAFKGIYNSLVDGGEFWIEARDLDSALITNRFTDFYIEHLVAHSIPSLKKCLSKIGFEYISHEILNFHGGLLRACFVKPKMKDFKKLQGFYDGRYHLNLIGRLKSAKKIVAYGASGECTVLLNQLKALTFSYVCDDAPSKRGKYLPGVGLPIVSSSELLKEDENTICLITAWTYKKEIMEKNKEFKGEWVTFF